MSDFVALQQQWTNWLRHPQTSPQPQIEQRRLTIYRELFFNNVSSFVNSAFPLLQQQLSTEVWQQLLDDFFANHHCQSPYFYDISSEFYQYLTSQSHLLADYPWLLELAHFEWAEIAADIAEGDWPSYEQGDLLSGVPVLNPFVWPLVYQWSVHQCSSSILEQKLSCILLYRDQEYHVETLEVSPLTLNLIEYLKNNIHQQTTQQIIEQMAMEQGLSWTLIKDNIVELLIILNRHDVLLGVKQRV